MTCSMQALAAQYTPARDCPSLEKKEQEVEKAEKWKQFDAIAYDLHHREKVAVRRLLQCYYYYASMQGIWFQ